MDTAKYILTIYSWVIVGALVVFLGRIGYFYEKTSGQRVGYCVFILPLLLLAVGALWYLAHDVDFTGQPVGDVLLCGGGVLLFLFGNRLRELMTGERQ